VGNMERMFELRDRQSIRHQAIDGYLMMTITFGNGEAHLGNTDIEGYGRPGVVFHPTGIFYGRVIAVEPFGANAEEPQPHLRLTIDGEPLFADVLVPYRV